MNYLITQKRTWALLALNIFVFLSLQGQDVTFVWMAGDAKSNQPGAYGTKGIGEANNTPGTRYNATTWTDKEGNLWLFGGIGIDGEGNHGALGDLWKYKISTGIWTWMHGSKIINQNSVFNTVGAYQPNNAPSSRWEALSWTDLSGNLWMFGGWTREYLNSVNDLWKYNITLNEWACMGVIKEVNYGTKGISSTVNMPGSRYSALTWTDATGKLWLFGGRGYVASEHSTGLGFLNDLWMLNTGTYEWTWVSGSNEQNQLGSFGSLGIANESNVPPSRLSSVSWQDTEGKFWLFGGMGPAEQGLATFINDFWQYDPGNNQWTWMGGSKEMGQPGIYGTMGIGSTINIPGARRGSISWTDSAGNFWLLGGIGATGEGPIEPGHANGLSDFWRFSPFSKEWTWIAGDNIQAFDWFFGTKGIGDSRNKPPGRENAVSWTDKDDNLWFFGGYTNLAYDSGPTNDLWVISLSGDFTQPDSTETEPVIEPEPDITPESQDEKYDEVIPNVITPNGDGINDFFVIPKIDLYPENRLTIVNRYGNKIIEISGYQNTWSAAEITSGLYYYSLYLSANNDIQVGWLQVLK